VQPKNQHTQIRLRAAEANTANSAYVGASSVGREGARIELRVEVGGITELDRPCELIHIRGKAIKAEWAVRSAVQSSQAASKYCLRRTVVAEFATKAVDRTISSNGQRGLNGWAPY
jgi:hypothetical protein